MYSLFYQKWYVPPKFASESGVIVKITRNNCFHCDKTELLKTQHSMSYIGDIWGFVFMNE